jgi:hypothetical protein
MIIFQETCNFFAEKFAKVADSGINSLTPTEATMPALQTITTL